MAEDKNEDPLVQLNKKFTKFHGVFVSMQKTMKDQTKILNSIYKLQAKSVKDDQKDESDQERKDKLKTVADDPKDRLKDDSGKKGTAAQMFEEAKGAFSLDGLVKGGLMLLLAPVIGKFVKDFVTAGLEQFGMNGESSSAFAEALGAGATWGLIGRIFGKKISLLFAAGGFLDSYLNLDEAVKWISDAFNLEMSDGLAENIGSVIGIAMAATLPGLIKKGIPLLFRKIMPSMLGLSPGAGPKVPPAAGGGRGAPPAVGGNPPRTPPGAPEPKYNPKTNRYHDPVTNKMVPRPQAPTPVPKAGGLLGKVGKGIRGVRGPGLLGAGLAVAGAGMALADDSLTTNEKTQEVAGATGGMVGGWAAGAGAGAAAGLVAGPVGAAIGAIVGGTAGYFLGDYAGRAMVGDASYSQETVDRLASTDFSKLDQDGQTKYVTELQEQFSAARNSAATLMNDGKSETPDYEHIQKNLSLLSGIMGKIGLEPPDPVANPPKLENLGVDYGSTYFKEGTNGFQNFGSGQMATLHGSEAVVPEKTVAGSIIKSLFGEGDWNSISGVQTALKSGLEFINKNTQQPGASVLYAPVTNTPVTNVYNNGGNATNNSSMVVLSSTGMDLDRPGYAR